MIEFGGKVERLACVLHEARMQECSGNWDLPHRFRWPETREQWEHYQHHPHSAVLQALAQAKAVACLFPPLDKPVCTPASSKLGIDNASITEQRLARQDHGEHGSQAEYAAQTRAAENTAGAEQRQGHRAPETVSADAASVEGSGQATEAERLLLVRLPLQSGLK